MKIYHIELLEGQLDIVLKSLEYHCYSANFLLDRKGKYTDTEDEKKIDLITNTYYKILSQLENYEEHSLYFRREENIKRKSNKKIV